MKPKEKHGTQLHHIRYHTPEKNKISSARRECGALLTRSLGSIFCMQHYGVAECDSLYYMLKQNSLAKIDILRKHIVIQHILLTCYTFIHTNHRLKHIQVYHN